jgi:hypothetical protein
MSGELIQKIFEEEKKTMKDGSINLTTQGFVMKKEKMKDRMATRQGRSE